MGDRFRMGASYNVEVCALGWIDLLGYGTQIYEAHLNPLSKKAKVALDRLESFNRHAFKALEPIIAGRLRGIRALLVNDGIAVLRDLTPRSSEPTQEFLWLCYQLHLQIRTADEIGARMVVCNGFRVRIQPTATSLNLKHSKAIAILSKMRSAPKEEIVREALQAHGPITSLSELQANFAFTKAYEAERRGMAGGLKGPQLFVEDSFFSDVDKSDFGLRGPSIQVELRKGMNVGFSVLERVPSKPRRSPGVRNAIEIATVLTRDKKIEEISERKNPSWESIGEVQVSDGTLYCSSLPPRTPLRRPAAGARLYAPNNGTLTMTSAIPVLDVSDFLAANPGAREAAAAELRHACEEVGFFFLQGHRVPWEVIEDAFEASRRFHVLPSSEKEALAANEHNIGFMPFEKSISRASQVYEGTRKPNLVAAYFLKRDVPEDHPDVVANKRFRGANQWPEKIFGFGRKIFPASVSPELQRWRRWRALRFPCCRFTPSR